MHAKIWNKCIEDICLVGLRNSSSWLEILKGSIITPTSHLGQTPLHMACEKVMKPQCLSRKCFKMHIMSQNPVHQLKKKKIRNISSWLEILKGSIITSTFHLGQTLLHLACEKVMKPQCLSRKWFKMHKVSQNPVHQLKEKKIRNSSSWLEILKSWNQCIQWILYCLTIYSCFSCKQNTVWQNIVAIL